MNDPDMGAWSYAYDALSNLTSQTDARGCATTLGYDSANRLAGKSYSGSGCNNTQPVSYSYDGILRTDTFDGISSLPDGWMSTASGVTVSGGQLHVTGNGSNWETYAYRTETITDTQKAHFIFKTSATSAEQTIYMSYNTWGNSAYRRWGILLNGGNISRQYFVGTTGNTVALMALKANTWYEGWLLVDSTEKFRAIVWERDNPTIWAQREDTFDSTWAKKPWSFYAQSKTGVLDLDYYQEIDKKAGLGRIGMVDGSGVAAWKYDERGRVITETRTITNTGTFVTQWGYNSADQVD